MADENKLAALLGGGMAGNAAKVMSSRAYQLHVQEAQALGEKPLTPEQFAAQKG
tara:strand:+ start:267 stop:428 length:162 start_codon:yes stop_codon:yes gene_type:complete